MHQPAAPDLADAPAALLAWDDAQAALLAWDDALTALLLFAVDPHGLGGVQLRSGAGPVRDAWLDGLRGCLGVPLRRVPAGIDDERLLGGLDLAATLAADRPVVRRGVLAETDGGVLLLAMAERLAAPAAARLAAVLDTGSVSLERDGLSLMQDARVAVVALDEGQDDERLAPALAERLGLRVDLGGIAWRAAVPAEPAELAEVAAARHRLGAVAAPSDAQLQALCATAAAYGVDSARAPLFALRAAAASAALAGRAAIDADDLALAARLVLLPRATRLPAAEPQPVEEPPAQPGESPPQELPPAEQPPQREAPPREPDARPEDDGPPMDSSAADDRDNSPLTPSELTEILLAAVAAALPPGLLAQLQAGAARGAATPGGGSGALRQSLTRGRPLGTRAGDPRGGARLDLLATLRAAAPWQRLRRREFGGGSSIVPKTSDCHPRESGDPSPAAGRRVPAFAGMTEKAETRDGPGMPSPAANPRRVLVRRDDFRIRRFAQAAESTTIFVVDASGSAALGRLAEAKGAVELLLAEAYVRRTQVALIAFRGTTAELLLPPTRSLARAKRSLGDLPGGGGTPLAAALDAALALAAAAQQRGRTPFVVLLTDGRANIARDGSVARDTAAADALAAARALRSSGCAAAFVDTAARPRPEAAALAAAMGARYVPLPRVDAGAMRDLVRTLAG